MPNNPTDDHATVEVPVTGNPLQEEDYALLRGSIDPLRNSDDYGVDTYLEALNFIHAKVLSY